MKEQLQARTQGTLNFAHIRSGAQGVDSFDGVCVCVCGTVGAFVNFYRLHFGISPSPSLSRTIIALI